MQLYDDLPSTGTRAAVNQHETNPDVQRFLKSAVGVPYPSMRAVDGILKVEAVRAAVWEVRCKGAPASMIVGPVWTCPPDDDIVVPILHIYISLSQDLELPQDLVYPCFPPFVNYGALSDEIHNPAAARELIVASTADPELKRFVAVLAQRNRVKCTEYDAVDAGAGWAILSGTLSL